MKKLLLTAIAVVGFSTISLANNQVESQITTTILYNDCDLRQEIAEDLALSNGNDAWEAYFYGAAEWGRCMGGN